MRAAPPGQRARRTSKIPIRSATSGIIRITSFHSALRDLATALAIIVRGLVANVALVLPVVLALAALTILANPDRTDLTGGPNIFGVSMDWLPVRYFGITLLISLIGFALFFAWAIYRSLLPAAKQSEFRTWLPTIGASYLIVIAVSFFCELQPFVISGMFSLADACSFVRRGRSFRSDCVRSVARRRSPHRSRRW